MKQFPPFARLRSLPRDERGQMTLVCAMMTFLIVIFTAIGAYTNIAIHRRITVQNAVDSAAEAAALWQARGCNLVQGLNNLHYTVNVVAGIAETAAAAACVAALIPKANLVACQLCVTAPAIDGGQQALNHAITNIQQWVVDATPYFTFLAANASAQGSGADRVTQAIPGAVSEWMKAVDSELSELLDVRTGLGAVGEFLDDLQASPILGAIPIYAAPLDVSSLDLHVHLRQGSAFPWSYPRAIGNTADRAGGLACGIRYHLARQGAIRRGWNSEEWGWRDSFFHGNPGYMTWIAGKRAPEDLIGLSSLAWMSGSRVDLESIRTLYPGPVDGGNLSVPAMLGLASSQVEGTPVVDKGDTDARGKLIKVYLPRTFEGEKLGLLH